MSQTIRNSVSYDNPITLSALSALCIVRNIKHFANEKVISAREFYLWKDGLLFSDWALEQIFEATLDNSGELSPRWLTLFLGSRSRALKLINVLVSPPLLGSIISDEGYSHLLAQSFLSIGSPRMRYDSNSLDEAEMTNSTQSSTSLFSGLVKLIKKFQRVVSVREKTSEISVLQDNTVPIDSQLTEDSVSVAAHSDSAAATRHTLCPAIITDSRDETNAAAQRQAIDCTGVLRRLVLRHNVSMPEAELLVGLLACAEPLEITIEDCSKLDSKFEVLELIAAHCPRLRTLKLYRCGSLLSQCFNRFDASPLSAPAMAHFASELDLSHLRVLALHDLPATATSSHTCDLLFQLAERLSTHLLELDLSGADFTACVTFEWLSRLRHLRVLLLADCKLPSDRSLIIGAICELHALIRLDMQHLRGETDLDTPPIRIDEFENPSQVLKQLSDNLPQLDHLDLSGTNLSGIANDLSSQNPLPGWPPERKLSFLGLWGCPLDASFRANLPAYRIAGEANVEQLIAALEAYAERKLVAQIILNSLVEHLKEPGFTIPLHFAGNCFELLLELIRRYSAERALQLLVLVLVFILIRKMEISNISPSRVKNLVLTLVDTLERHATDKLVVSNCLLILCEVNNNKQKQLLFIYERLVKLLLRIAEHPAFRVSVGDGVLPQRDTALDLLRVSVRQVDVPEKRVFGEVGGVRVALSILEQRLYENANHDDKTVGLCWNLLISATDESARNCELFVELGGLELFVRCAQKWVDHKELYSDMLIALINVSEVKSLRGHLKSDQFIGIFRKLLDMPSGDNDNRISFCTAAVLSQILADGEHSWHQQTDSDNEAQLPVALAHSHSAVCDQIVAAIDRWDPNANFKICYISLLPLLSLISSFDSFASQYWAAWTLNNLTLLQPDMYCPMLVREGSLDLLDAIIADARSRDKLRHWLVLTADRTRDHIIKQHRPGDSSPQVQVPL